MGKKKLEKQKKALMKADNKLVQKYNEASKKPQEYCHKTFKKLKGNDRAFRNGLLVPAQGVGKKEAEALVLMAQCDHFKTKKNGKRVPAIHHLNDDYVICDICRQKIARTPIGNSTLRTMITDMTSAINQTKYISTSYNLGKDVNAFLSSTIFGLAEFNAIHQRVNTIAKKLGDKQNRKRQQMQNQPKAGSWNARGGSAF